MKRLVQRDRAEDAPRPRIGIPRALLYYEYAPLWQAFLSSLGAEVITSPLTNAKIIDDGVSLAVDEACLPVKVFCGHVNALTGNVDFIFVPRVVSVFPREYTCPKLLGLPEMLSQQLEGSGQRLLTADVNLYRGRARLLKACEHVARQLGKDRLAAARALLLAIRANRWHEAGDSTARQTPATSLEFNRLRIGVLGHRYLVKDEGVNLGLLRHLKNSGVDVMTEDNLSARVIERAASCLPKPLYWSFEKKVVGAAIHMMEKHLVDGLVQLVSFGCGPDSMLAGLIESWARRAKVPYLLLSVDEHSGEAGTVTRVEAFIDMIMWKAGRQ